MKESHVMEGPSSSSPKSPITVGIVGQPQGAKAVTLVSRADSLGSSNLSRPPASPSEDVVDLSRDRTPSPTRAPSTPTGSAGPSSPGQKGQKSRGK
eukprot:9829337-Karenia_brevis.AAC.1